MANTKATKAPKATKKASTGGFAVIKTGGKQYRVSVNDLIKIEKMEGLNGKKQFGEDLLEYEIRYAGL
jgi:hypothetical protein